MGQIYIFVFSQVSRNTSWMRWEMKPPLQANIFQEYFYQKLGY